MNTHRKHGVFRTLIVILVAAVLLTGGVSIAQAAAQAAIPGDALYSVKTTFEQTRLRLAQDAGDRAEMRTAFAEQRLEEIAALIAENRFTEVSNAVLAFEANINSAILELETVARVNPERAARIAQEVTENSHPLCSNFSRHAGQCP